MLSGPAAEEAELAGITSVAAGQPRNPREVDLAEHTPSFAVSPAEPASAFVAAPPELRQDLLCVQDLASRSATTTACAGGPHAADPAQPSPRRDFVRSTVPYQHPYGTVAIFKGPHRLATFLLVAEPPAQDMAA